MRRHKMKYGPKCSFRNWEGNFKSDCTQFWDAVTNALKMDCSPAARTALRKIQEELALKEVEQWVRSELENTVLRENLDALEKTVKAEDNQEPKTRNRCLKIKVKSMQIT